MHTCGIYTNFIISSLGIEIHQPKRGFAPRLSMDGERKSLSEGANLVSTLSSAPVNPTSHSASDSRPIDDDPAATSSILNLGGVGRRPSFRMEGGRGRPCGRLLLLLAVVAAGRSSKQESCFPWRLKPAPLW